jgi:hypothetical protein
LVWHLLQILYFSYGLAYGLQYLALTKVGELMKMGLILVMLVSFNAMAEENRFSEEVQLGVGAGALGVVSYGSHVGSRKAYESFENNNDLVPHRIAQNENRIKYHQLAAEEKRLVAEIAKVKQGLIGPIKDGNITSEMVKLDRELLAVRQQMHLLDNSFAVLINTESASYAKARSYSKLSDRLKKTSFRSGVLALGLGLGAAAATAVELSADTNPAVEIIEDTETAGVATK